MRVIAAVSTFRAARTLGECDDLRACLARVGRGGLRVATLGPMGTSSEFAARCLVESLSDELPAGEVGLYPSFESAVEAVLGGTETAAVVANAYSEIDAMYMNPALALAGAFILSTPDYGIAARTGSSPPREVRVATHPAPVALVEELLPPVFRLEEIVEAPSTSEAARMTARREIDLALTNERSAKEYDLRFVSETRPIRMLWSVFVARARLGEGI